MIVFYGLGNNEQKYLQTKHNIGRLVVEEAAKIISATDTVKGDKYIFSKCRLLEVPIYFLFSLGYMNTSGAALTSFIKYYKPDPERLQLVIFQDDSDQLEGKKKLVSGGGSAGHRGIDDIYKHLLGLGISSAEIWRLKIGIRPPGNKLKSETFVLKRLGVADEKIILDLSKTISANLSLFLSKDFTKLQNIINSEIPIE